MSYKQSQEQAPDAEQSFLQNKPQRQSGWRGKRVLSSLLLLIGGIAIVGTAVVLTILFLSSRSTPTPSTSTVQPAGSAKQAPASCGQGIPQPYWDTLQQQTAQGLHLTVVQIKTQLHSGKQIQNVAEAQGISQSQLHTIEVNALQAANKQLVTMGCTSQSQADANVQDYVNRGSTDMNNRFTFWLAQ